MRIWCVTLDPATEDLLNGCIDRSPGATTVNMPPAMVANFAEQVSTAAEPLVRAGHRIVLLASPNVRAQARQMLEPHVPGVVVLAYNEIDRGIDVESVGLVHVESTPATAGAAWSTQGARPVKASTYLANSMDEAIAAVRRDLGSDAVILESRTVRRGGVFGLFARRVIELRAATAMEVRTSRRSAEDVRIPAARG